MDDGIKDSKVNTMRKVLWLTNFRFANAANSGSGTWIEAMGRGLAADGRYEIFNITLGNVKQCEHEQVDGIKQWTFPIRMVAKRPLSAHLPSHMVASIVALSEKIRPDLIHVWGTERTWGLLTARSVLNFPALLEMQGITSAIAPYHTGCLSPEEIRACRWIKEWLRPHTSLTSTQRQFVKSIDNEHEMYRGHRFIDCQSEWVRNYIEPYAQGAKIYKTRIMLRTEFLNADPWQCQPKNHRIFTTCGWAAAKGTHVIIRACALLRRKYPDLKLVIAGHHQNGVRQSGYTRWVEKEISRLGVDAEILGGVDPSRMIKEMKKSAVFVHPSLVESYSLSLAEAMAVGCPCVASYAGAMPEVGGDACLYFPIADAGACAGVIDSVFADPQAARDLGAMAMRRSRALHDVAAGLSRQIEIYEDIFRQLKRA